MSSDDVVIDLKASTPSTDSSTVESKPVKKTKKTRVKKATKVVTVSSDEETENERHVSFDGDSYFANFDAILARKEESIVFVSSGSRAVYKNVTELEKILRKYSAVKQGEEEETEALPACWLDIQYPTVETMVLISRAFGIHTLTMEDCLSETEDQHQKNELFDNYRFLSFSEYHNIPYTNVVGNVDIHIILPEAASNILISLHNGPAMFIGSALRALSSPRNDFTSGPHDHPRSHKDSNSSKRLSMSSPRASLSKKSAKFAAAAPPPPCIIPSSHWVMYVILDSIVDLFVQLVDKTTYEVEQLDSLVLDLPPREQADLLLRMGEARKQMSMLRLQLLRKQDILHTISLEAKDAALLVQHQDLLAPHPSHSSHFHTSSKHDGTAHHYEHAPVVSASSSSPIIHDDVPSTSSSTTSIPVLGTEPLMLRKDPAEPSIFVVRSQPVTPFLSPASLSPSAFNINAPHNRGIASIRIFLRDILDHINTMLIDLEQAKETLINLTNAYQARVSIEMSISASEQNQVMKKFSAMATIILPLTFVPSLWGMNVPVPGEKSKGTWAFWTIVGSLVAVGIIASIVFWRIKWL